MSFPSHIRVETEAGEVHRLSPADIAVVQSHPFGRQNGSTIVTSFTDPDPRPSDRLNRPLVLSVKDTVDRLASELCGPNTPFVSVTENPHKPEGSRGTPPQGTALINRNRIIAFAGTSETSVIATLDVRRPGTANPLPYRELVFGNADQWAAAHTGALPKSPTAAASAFRSGAPVTAPAGKPLPKGSAHTPT